MRTAMEMAPPTTEEDLKLLEVRLTQLKLEYEKYFLGSRPTEPSQARSEMQQTVIRLSNMRITNTAQRFKFNSLNGRFQAFKRQWDNVLRQIDAGTYKRHLFKADLRDRERGLDVVERGEQSLETVRAEDLHPDVHAHGQDALRRVVVQARRAVHAPVLRHQPRLHRRGA